MTVTATPLPLWTTGVTLASHARWPESALEWAIGVVAVAVTVWVLWLCVRWTVSPREDAPDHVKRSILDDDVAPPPRPPAP